MQSGLTKVKLILKLSRTSQWCLCFVVSEECFATLFQRSFKQSLLRKPTHQPSSSSANSIWSTCWQTQPNYNYLLSSVLSGHPSIYPGHTWRLLSWHYGTPLIDDTITSKPHCWRNHNLCTCFNNSCFFNVGFHRFTQTVLNYYSRVWCWKIKVFDVFLLVFHHPLARLCS